MKTQQKNSEQKTDAEILREQQLEICDDVNEILYREFNADYLKEIESLKEKNNPQISTGNLLAENTEISKE